MKTKRILLVEDHRILRQAIKIQFDLDAPHYLVDECSDGSEALLLLSKNEYDLMISDINMPRMDGFELVKLAKEHVPRTKLLIVSMFTDYKYISKMVELGVDGYLSKNTDHQELIDAIDIILDGENYYSKEVSRNLIQGMRSNKQQAKLVNTISKRELEVLNLVLKEFTNKEIAGQLFISTRTVETHKYNLLQKTNSRNIAGLFKFAVQNELFEDLV